MFFINSRIGKTLMYTELQYTRLLQKRDRARSKIFLKIECITLTSRKAANLTRLQHSAQGWCTQHRGMGFKTKLTFNLLITGFCYLLIWLNYYYRCVVIFLNCIYTFIFRKDCKQSIVV